MTFCNHHMVTVIGNPRGSSMYRQPNVFYSNEKNDKVDLLGSEMRSRPIKAKKKALTAATYIPVWAYVEEQYCQQHHPDCAGKYLSCFLVAGIKIWGEQGHKPLGRNHGSWTIAVDLVLCPGRLRKAHTIKSGPVHSPAGYSLFVHLKYVFLHCVLYFY